MLHDHPAETANVIILDASEPVVGGIASVTLLNVVIIPRLYECLLPASALITSELQLPVPFIPLQVIISLPVPGHNAKLL